jgi:8-amino-7-oxononanoate synthase
MTKLKALLTEFCAERPSPTLSGPWDRPRQGSVRCNGAELFDFTSFDVFGLWQTSSVKRAALQEFEASGFSPHARRDSGGFSFSLERFEQRAAVFFGAGGAVAFDTRNQAVLTVITTLVGDGDVVFFDRISDLPVFDACSVSGARAVAVDLSDLRQFRHECERVKWSRRRILVAESVNGVTGKAYPIGDVEVVCNELRVGVVWDDSFALGGYGLRGLPESNDCVWSPTRLIRFAALNRFAGALGCIAAAPRVLLDTIASRSHFLQNEPPIPSCVAALGSSVLDALELRVSDRERIGVLWTRVASAVSDLGWSVLGDLPGPIVSFHVESRRIAEELRTALKARAVLVDALSDPVSDVSRGVIRIVLAAFHDDRAVTALLNGLSEVRARLGA